VGVLLEGIRAGSEPYGSLGMPSRFRSGGGEYIGLPDSAYIAADLGVWHDGLLGSAFDPYKNPVFLNINGHYLEDEIDAKLLEFGYEKLDYQGVTYYALFEDYEQNLHYPLRMGAFNRIALLDDWLLAAPATDLLTALIDIHQGNGDGFMDSDLHRKLAEAVGVGILTEVFKDQTVIKDPGIPGNYMQLSLPIFQRYMDGPNKWGTLSDYNLTLAGYRIRDNVEEIAIALYYSDPSLAEKDRAEIEHRWNTYGVNLPNIYDNYPATEACAPLSTQVIKGEGYSILVASCPFKRGEANDRLLDTPTLWGGVPHRVLHPDLEELRDLQPYEATP
jgi:hypothetical protein